MSTQSPTRGTTHDISAANARFVEQCESPDPVQREKAAAAGTEYVRTIIQEEGIARHVLPPRTITNDDLITLCCGDEEGEIPPELEQSYPLLTAVFEAPFLENA